MNLPNSTLVIFKTYTMSLGYQTEVELARLINQPIKKTNWIKMLKFQMNSDAILTNKDNIIIIKTAYLTDAN